MTKPANLEYAFRAAEYYPEVGLYDPTRGGVVAYRIIGSSYTADPEAVELDASLSPGFDYNLTAGDGDGSVGQYVVFGLTPNTTDEHRVARQAAWGFDPFDPANHKPTTVRYWELQPGSDVMATTLGVLPKVGTSGGYDAYWGLVTVPAGTVPDWDDTSDSGWVLHSPDAVIVSTDTSYLSIVAGNGDSFAAGVYAAEYNVIAGGPPPLAFPAGWTPGNTTGSGPVLPYLGESGGYDYYGGLVAVPDPSLFDDNAWAVIDKSTALTTDAFNAASSDGFNNGSGSGPDRPPAGVHVGWYYVEAGGPAPTALPTGWTFRPYGLGPVAITDENAGGVIGDIAYVVSGYVHNATEVWAPTIPDYVGTLADGNHVLEVGNVFFLPAYNSFRVCTVAGTLTVTSGGFGGSPDGFEMVFWDTTWDYAWPFLERYNLKTKTWLPRIQLPMVRKTVEFSSTTKVINGYTTMTAGPYVFGPGEVPINGPGDRVQSLVDPFVPSSEYAGGTAAAIPFPAGTYLVNAGGEQNAGAPPTTAEELAALLGGVAITQSLTHTYGPYAAEGGFAGVINGKLYFGGGDGQYTTGTEFFSYDPATEEFTRLEDMSGPYNPDYSAYGVVGGKLWVNTTHSGTFNFFWVYTPGSGWETHDVDGYPQLPADQIQGVEIGGKLYFVYGNAFYVFDPASLTVSVGPDANGGHRSHAGVANGKLLTWAAMTDATAEMQAFDPATGIWVYSEAPAPAGGWSVNVGESVGLVYRGTPYQLSGNRFGSPYVAGVYGLTGNAPTYEAPPALKLVHTGLPWRVAQALQAEETGDTCKELVRAGMSIRQAKTWLRGDHSMKALLRGGFTRNQAKLLKEI